MAMSLDQSREFFDHLTKTDNFRASLPHSSSIKFSISSKPFHTGSTKATRTRCNRMSDMSALVSLTFCRRRSMKYWLIRSILAKSCD